MLDGLQIDSRIVSMDIWHLKLPVNARRDHGIGAVSDHVEVVVLRLTSDCGRSGFGEASPWAVFTGTPEGNFAALDRYLRPLIIGSRVSDWQQTMQSANRLIVHHTEAKAALETALLDLAGRIVDRPVSALLGEQCRDSIPMSVSIANPDFDEDRALLERIYNDGIRIVKFKTGFADQAFDQMRVETVKKLYPDMRIRIDYNQGLATNEALPRVIAIDQLEPDFIEQPVRAHEFEMMAKLRSATRAPLLADESVFGPEDLQRAIKEQICDGVSVKIMKSGGLSRGMQVAANAAQHGLPAYGGDMFETGIAHLAGVHMIAASPNITLGCEFYQATYYLEEDLLCEPFPLFNGEVRIPDGAGLGIDVNTDKLSRFAVQSATA